ncbi:MAG: hypothetical protein WA005_12210 [Candidatus Binataceae bacterium]
MTGARFIGLTLAAMLIGGSACSPVHDQAQPTPARRTVSIDRPVALATLRTPVLVGSHGQIMGYIPGWPFPGPEPAYEAGDAMFTYVVDFTIVEMTAPPRIYPVSARGVRRIYFHPEGVRIAFGDPDSFVNGAPIATDQVTFTFGFSPDFRKVVLRGLLHRLAARAFDYEGHTITPPESDEGSFELQGRSAPQYSSPRQYFALLLRPT